MTGRVNGLRREDTHQPGGKDAGIANGCLEPGRARPDRPAGGVGRMSAPSYVHGASPVPLLGETIGTNLRRTVERFPDHDALIVPDRKSVV
jgi:hypothetical protein